MSKSKKNEKILEQSYTIEALQDEIENLETIRQQDLSRIWELIQHNDRLTLTYEPYIPPGHEDEGLTFYGLKEENDMLTQKVLDKMGVIDELDAEVCALHKKVMALTKSFQSVQNDLFIATSDNAIIRESAPQIPVKTKKVRNERWWNFSVELWPGAWGLNYYRYDWQRAQANGHPATSREGNFQIGPFGFSWNREPKR